MQLKSFIIIFFFISKISLAIEDTEARKKMNVLAEELRCMVCQNQSLLESDSELAKDLKALIEEKFKKGETEKEIKNYLVERYGEFILFSPKINAGNIILWLSPLISILFISFIAYRKNFLSKRK